MEYRYRMSQEELKYLYESAKGRMDAHPEYADKYRKIVEQQCSYFKTEREALQYVLDAKAKEKNYTDYQIWVKFRKDGDIFRLEEWWTVISDNKVKMAADYIGLALMYDDSRIHRIIYDKVNIDEVVDF